MTAGDAAGEKPSYEDNRSFLVGLARAFAGALIFSLPMLMTMEMWWIGFYMSPWRLALLLTLMIPLLVGLSVVSGFKVNASLRDDVADAFVAIAVAVVMSTVILFIFKVLTVDMPAREIVGKIALQSFPAAIGAMLARDQLGEKTPESTQRQASMTYGQELFLMGVGALFLGFNVAPTEEMVLLSYMMDPWREIALLVLSLVLMHGFVYAVEFPGGSKPRPGVGFWSLFLRFTVVGYVLVLAICLFLLWTFGRTDGTGVAEILSATVVLGFPCAIGAASARLIL
ncbi:TIGR02587 family membrane protein [Azospirillum picis]|uniref:Integral membrane protein (TIGR02587 family) n=1 Tax=Azospirillum picis TaxID=488438 RepID=A0ABU0MRB2_9PROT|nr:TIGR02587 family membrane protein [Azospirillum picis]MBP2302426.1 putative integral membrane protein (TIGR02587 family) [Azospirillum picis]MDQ0536005.1 putative integral membrane protein (TIGR02587 family) [Azospirillum picis]